MHIEKKMKETERKAAAEAAIRKNCGVVSHEALIAEGLSKTDIHRLSKAGYIKSIRRGYYSAGDNSASEEERIAAEERAKQEATTRMDAFFAQRFQNSRPKFGDQY